MWEEKHAIATQHALIILEGKVKGNKRIESGLQHNGLVHKFYSDTVSLSHSFVVSFWFSVVYCLNCSEQGGFFFFFSLLLWATNDGRLLVSSVGFTLSYARGKAKRFLKETIRNTVAVDNQGLVNE